MLRVPGTPRIRDPQRSRPLCIQDPHASGTPSIRGPHARSLAQKQPHPRRKPSPRRPPSASHMVTLPGVTPVGASAPGIPNTALCPPLSQTWTRGSAEPREKGLPPPPPPPLTERETGVPDCKLAPCPPSLSFPIRLSLPSVLCDRGGSARAVVHPRPLQPQVRPGWGRGGWDPRATPDTPGSSLGRNHDLGEEGAHLDLAQKLAN